MRTDTGMTMGKTPSAYRIKPTLTGFVLIPIGSGALLLALFVLYSGWWKDLWRDKSKLGKPAWLSLFAITIILGIVANFASGNFFSNPVALLLVGAVSMACVGFSEEILFRGIVLRGARGSGFSETNYIPDPVGRSP